MGQGQEFFGERMLSPVPTLYKDHWFFFFLALSEELSNILFQRQPHGHDTWTRVRAVRSLVEAWAWGNWTEQAADPSLSLSPLSVSRTGKSSAVSALWARCIVYHVALVTSSIAWWFWPLRLPLRPLMRKWKTKLSLPMSPLHRQKDCSSGNTVQEVRGGSWPFVLNTTPL